MVGGDFFHVIHMEVILLPILPQFTVPTYNAQPSTMSSNIQPSYKLLEIYNSLAENPWNSLSSQLQVEIFFLVKESFNNYV